ncbi:Glyceraldehyde-3-phosphate dehydrogenase-like protein [wastewater metagenome]|uniref:Glyceraldehyde-3-phosphate dehydrogenase-like protein n=2 Tax=unclassified sequences TaxID=12908 RepID=A0A5B8R907_9ZZZZ|nr:MULTISPECIES: glyceraldehyde-3-phosphate dehydrogenase [Arhodomonas]MCS4503560.1 glyceraldehyde-3-phosphate dehydrogenase [Arhodomonas aquaeolei]QEA04438.1 glyceraldehyde-3-phosphate dehydrogenase-like protein [uncultured organism]
MSITERDLYLQQWKQAQELAEQMLPMIGRLYRDRGLVLRIYGRPLNNVNTVDILKAHRFVKQYEGEALDIRDSFAVLEALTALRLAPARLDLGRLAVAYGRLEEPRPALTDWLREELADIVDREGPLLNEPQDVVLYGFGRIGRLLARLLIEKTGAGNKMRLRAVVVRPNNNDDDLDKRASLLRRDSVHGPFNGSIFTVPEENAIVANGNYIKVIYANDPAEIDYTEYGIKDALILDNTGKWRDEAGLSRHLEATGAGRVLLTAPGKGDLKNIVFGVNHRDMAPEDRILSAASCTTNAITPVLKVINERYGIEYGHVETVHAYTNDQNLTDNYHKGSRRGRSAPLNMVLTETGAAKAVAKALPELSGKLTGNAIRVPTPNVSLAVMNLTLNDSVDEESLREFLRDAALYSDVAEQIDYTASTEAVSTDLVGSRHAGVIDSASLIAQDRHCVVYVWYDNEMGYSCQVMRIAQEMAGLHFPRLPRS